jgi:hypothetical protein
MKILDMSAGNRAMWFNRSHRLATYLDCRSSVKPTICCDTRDMPSEVGDGYNLNRIRSAACKLWQECGNVKNLRLSHN